MKALPAGTRKFLTFDKEAVRRNIERPRRQAPTVIVYEELADGAVVEHTGYGVKTDGPVEYVYDRGGRTVVKKHRVTIPAIFSTTGAVVIAEEADEAIELPAKKTTPKTTKGTNE